MMRCFIGIWSIYLLLLVKDISAQSQKPTVVKVPMMSIGTTDYIKDNTVPFITQDKEEDEILTTTDGFSICFWMEPFRFQGANDIIIISTKHEKQTKSIKLELNEKKFTFYVDSSCSHIIEDFEAIARVWTHVCILFTTDGVSIFRDSDHLHTSTTCKTNGTYFLNKFQIILGADGSMYYPFIGRIADLRIFRRNISIAEITSISKVSGTPDDYLTIEYVNSTETDYSSDYSYYYDYSGYSYAYYSGSGDNETWNETGSGSGHGDNYYGYSYDYSGSGDYSDFEYEENSLEDFIGIFSKRKNEIIFGKIEKSFLLGKSNRTNFYYFPEKTMFEEAETICRRFGGAIPNAKDIPRIQKWAIRMNNNIGSFWFKKPTESLSKNESCLSGLMLPSKKKTVKSIPAFCTSSNNVLCKSIPGVLIRGNNIPGGPHESELTHVMESDKMTLDDFGNLFFYFDEKPILRDLLSVDAHSYSMSVSRFSECIGRKKWSVDGSPNKETEILLTTCSEGLFTCDNGDCVNITQVCDITLDCLDFSDEKYCELTLNANEDWYNPKYSDAQSVDERTNISVALYLDNINKVNMADGKIDLQLSIYTSWYDKRLKFKYVPPSIYKQVAKEEFKTFWLPNIVIEGADQNNKNKLSTLSNPGYIVVSSDIVGEYKTIATFEVLETPGKHVNIHHYKQDSVELKCKMELFYFPFDTQTCVVKLEIKGILLNDAQFDAEESSAVLYVAEMSVTLFDITQFKLISDQWETHKAYLYISLERKYGAYIFNTFLPCIILELIGLLTHAIPFSDLSDRLTVTLSCLIVMAALFTQVSSTLPTSAEPKLIDIWMCAHVGILFLVFLVHICMSLAYEREEEEEQGRKEAQQSIKHNADILENKKWAVMKTVLELDQINIGTPPSKKKSFWRWLRTTRIINRIGFILCTFIYILFCFVFVLLLIINQLNMNKQLENEGEI